MSLDQALRDVVRREISAELAPLKALIEEFRNTSLQLGALTQLASKLAPLMGVSVSLPTFAKRRGRPVGSGRAARVSRRRGPKAINDRPCAIIGCRRPARVKGYCAAHYQKLRNLQKSNRLPSTWVDFPAAGSIPDVKLPRGRAAVKAKASAVHGSAVAEPIV